jgi:hypothetical protein
MASFCEHGNESLGSVKCREFLDLLRVLQLLKKGCTPWSLVTLQLAKVTGLRSNISQNKMWTTEILRLFIYFHIYKHQFVNAV